MGRPAAAAIAAPRISRPLTGCSAPSAGALSPTAPSMFCTIISPNSSALAGTASRRPTKARISTMSAITVISVPTPACASKLEWSNTA